MAVAEPSVTTQRYASCSNGRVLFLEHHDRGQGGVCPHSVRSQPRGAVSMRMGLHSLGQRARIPGESDGRERM
jgi:hypothetical protein